MSNPEGNEIPPEQKPSRGSAALTAPTFIRKFPKSATFAKVIRAFVKS